MASASYPDSSTSSQLWTLACGPRHVRSWLPEVEPRCAIVIVHGLGDYSGRFEAPAAWLRNAGAAVYAFDQVGHGQSPGKRMCIPSYQSLLDDIGYVLAEVADQHGNVPLGLIGQSMGGNLVLNYALRKMPHADFVVASSPMLRSPGAPGPIAEFFARGILAIMPDFYLAAPVRVERLAKNEQVQKRFIEDNLVQHKVSLRLGAALIDSGKWALQNASRLAMPALVIHGDKDEITSPTASEEFVLGAKDWAELKIWPNGLHDLHLDDERESYMQFMWDWIRRQLVC